MAKTWCFYIKKGQILAQSTGKSPSAAPWWVSDATPMFWGSSGLGLAALRPFPPFLLSALSSAALMLSINRVECFPTIYLISCRGGRAEEEFIEVAGSSCRVNTGNRPPFTELFSMWK